MARLPILFRLKDPFQVKGFAPIISNARPTVAVAVTGAKLGPDLSSSGAAFGTSATGWGQCLTSPHGFGAATDGTDVIPSSSTFTAEIRFKIASVPGGIVVMFGVDGSCWIGVNSSGVLAAIYGTAGGGGNSLTGGTNVCDGNWHHARIVSNGGSGGALYLDGTLETSSGTARTFSGDSTFDLAGLLGSFAWPGSLDEFAAWSIATNASNFTAPSSPYAGSESGLVSLYHLDGDLTSATSGAAVSINGIGSGALPLSGSAAATVKVQASATGSLPLTGNSTAKVKVQGNSTGSIGLTGSSTGKVKIQATGIGSLPLTGAASGTVKVRGSASGALPLTGTGTESEKVKGSATISLALTGSASATVKVRGSASGTLPLTGSAASSGTVHATGSGSITFSGSASGKVAVKAASSGSIGFSGSATGRAKVRGAANDNLTLAGSATGAVSGATGFTPGPTPLARIGHVGRQLGDISVGHGSRVASVGARLRTGMATRAARIGQVIRRR